MSDKSIHECASRLNVKVAARVQALQADMMAVATYDASMLLADFQRVARVAVEKEQLTAAVSALTAIGKIIGAFPQPQRELMVRHSGRGAVQDSPTPSAMTAERARGILGASEDQARVPYRVPCRRDAQARPTGGGP